VRLNEANAQSQVCTEDLNAMDEEKEQQNKDILSKIKDFEQQAASERKCQCYNFEGCGES
jgi:hypothetical protein